VTASDVKKYKEAEVKKALLKLIKELDALDLEDFFGSEGWRHRLGFEE
jgi:hypothetical protein